MRSRRPGRALAASIVFASFMAGGPPVFAQDQVGDLSARAQRHEKMQRGDGWGDPSPIG